MPFFVLRLQQSALWEGVRLVGWLFWLWVRVGEVVGRVGGVE